ncbi:hypothetical protein HF086_012317 [Spodoptera exigua]|uniref:Uncharacterized protein n=1 Tax=Spodoptera exigua TaxID=7107 RepID=A0A922MTV5_SPOEX|nr:hypothetical protein HF086_012317 [Spodoptera exigua]
MPRIYSRKTDRQGWDKTSMEKAIEDVNNNEMGWLLASKSNNISPHRLYNVDESALSTVQRPQKVFATTGREQVGTLTSAEKGSHVTVVCCMSVNGHFVPPCLIYPRKIMKQELIDEAPTGAILNKAYGKAATIQTAVNGFQKTGLWPVDPNIFPDYLFEPAETTNIPMQQDRVEPKEDSTVTENLCIPSSGPSQVEAGSSKSLIIASTSAADNPLPLSVALSRDTATAIPTTPTSSKLILQDMNINIINIPVSVLSPVPIGTYVAGQGKRKRKKPTILVLTSTPNIEEAKAKSNDFSSLQAFTEVGDDDEDCPCIYCNDLYSRSKPKEVSSDDILCVGCFELLQNQTASNTNPCSRTPKHIYACGLSIASCRTHIVSQDCPQRNVIGTKMDTSTSF